MAGIDRAQEQAPQQPVLIYDRIGANQRQTLLLMFVFVVLLGAFASLVALHHRRCRSP